MGVQRIIPLIAAVGYFPKSCVLRQAIYQKIQYMKIQYMREHVLKERPQA